MKLASAEDTGGMNLVEEDDDMDNSTEKQYDDIEDDVGMDDGAE